MTPDGIHIVADQKSYDRMLATLIDAAWLIGMNATSQAEMDVAFELSALLRFLYGQEGKLH